MSPILQTLANGSARGYGAFGASAAPTPSYESIASAIGAGASSVVFSSIPQTFKHLQLRILSGNSLGTQMYVRFNGDTGANYSRMRLRGNDPNVQVLIQTGMSSEVEFGLTGDQTTYDTKMMGATIFDILDYSSTTKKTTGISLSGFDINTTGGRTEIHRVLWNNTDAVTEVGIWSPSGRTWSTNSTFALYGIKGS